MPNRYLPILQEGKIDSLRQAVPSKKDEDSRPRGP